MMIVVILLQLVGASAAPPKTLSFAGDCLLDSVLQATWGVFDRDNSLRRALAASITDASHLLYPRWKEYETLQARMLDYAVPENQVRGVVLYRRY